MADSAGREEEKAVARPTLRLLNLPPGTSPSMIKALMPSNLTVEGVKILPPAAGPTGKERKAATAILTLSQETPANDMDAAVSALQHRYLGFGYYMSLHRHLSSAALTATTGTSLSSSTSESHPFGAKPVETPQGAQRSQQHQGFHRGFAPPSSYDRAMGGVDRSSLLHVPVKPPQDVKTVQLISKVIEGILAHGPEFEALLMSRPEVQREEKWAWLWDARSDGGIWLRWRLWEVVTGGQQQSKGKYVPIFDGSYAWKMPESKLPFEYTTSLDEFVSDSEYNSSDDEDYDGDGQQQGNGDDEKTFLNPLEKAKLTHLLARLPRTISRLRKGDIARVTAFAIMHASRGADEVVDMIVRNVSQPLSLTSANPERRQQDDRAAKGDDREATTDDAGAASLVGLYVVSDILSASSASNVRHAWRFRQLFEAALRESKLFEALGSMSERRGWGRLRAEKWKRSVGLVLSLWDGWCVFPAESQEAFTKGFENPPVTATPEVKPERVEEGERMPLPLSMIEDDDVEGEKMDEDDVVGEPLDEEDVEGEPIEEDDIAGEPIDEEDIEGSPIGDNDVIGEPIGEDDILRGESAEDSGKQGPRGSQPEGSPPGRDGTGAGDGMAPSRRKRMRAVDMFADSEGEEGA
jgi:U2-associated protein SR140